MAFNSLQIVLNLRKKKVKQYFPRSGRQSPAGGTPGSLLTADLGPGPWPMESTAARPSTGQP